MHAQAIRRAAAQLLLLTVIPACVATQPDSSENVVSEALNAGEPSKRPVAPSFSTFEVCSSTTTSPSVYLYYLFRICASGSEHAGVV